MTTIITTHAIAAMLGAIIGAVGILALLVKASPSCAGDAIDKETRRKT